MSLSDNFRVILHVDLDAFYVSAESREHPELKGRPLVVGADPENGRGRGVVVACSYEARKFGLRSGMPISKAYRLCPGATYLRPDWALYERTSTEVMDTLKEYADKFEQASIDEAFLDVTSKAKDEAEARSYAMKVKQAVREKNGLSCSIGVASNKSAAKIASDMDKPDGLTVVPFGKVEEFLSPLQVSVIPGIGPKTHAFLKEKGVETVGQLQKFDGKQLMQWFGKNGVWLWGVVHGQESIEVRQQETKSLSVERTFGEDLSDFEKVRAEARDAAAELSRRVKSSGFDFRVVGIKIRLSGFETHTREKTLTSPTDSLGTLQEVSGALLDEFEGGGRAVRLVGIRVSGLKKESQEPTILDEWSG